MMQGLGKGETYGVNSILGRSLTQIAAELLQRLGTVLGAYSLKSHKLYNVAALAAQIDLDGRPCCSILHMACLNRA